MGLLKSDNLPRSTLWGMPLRILLMLYQSPIEERLTWPVRAVLLGGGEPKGSLPTRLKVEREIKFILISVVAENRHLVYCIKCDWNIP